MAAGHGSFARGAEYGAEALPGTVCSGDEKSIDVKLEILVERGMRLFKGLWYFCGCLTVPQM